MKYDFRQIATNHMSDGTYNKHIEYNHFPGLHDARMCKDTE